VPHDKETRTDPSECARLVRRIRVRLRKRDSEAGSRTATAITEDLATPVSPSKQPSDRAECCSPWAA
jgi:hypothetical protein